MKEIIGKTKTKTRNLPWGIAIREKYLHEKKIIAKQFNNCIINIGPNIATNLQSYRGISYENLLK